MSHGRPPAVEIENSLTPTEGWHCSHLYYEFDRAQLAKFGADRLKRGREEFIAALNPEGDDATERLQASVVSGHKADFALMLMDPCPLKIDTVHQNLLAGALGPALRTTWSFVSITEVSEYVPTVEQYSEKLILEGETKGSDTYEAKVNAYSNRLPMMNKQRLTPDFPDWPATCFYPMNKSRRPGANWFMEASSKRNELMSEHALSGRQFANKVTQLISVGLGVDDWEWGVTLWARNPEFLADIVYKMRFDEASAKYAEFGPFYVSYIKTAAEVLDHCRVACE